MHRAEALNSLSVLDSLIQAGALRHRSFDLTEENEAARRIQSFVRTNDKCFERDFPPGHVTGSAMVTNPSGTKVLLTLHRKLGIWLQLGGHCDGDGSVVRVAWREAMEEAGIEPIGIVDLRPLVHAFEVHRGASDLQPLEVPLPFDVDIHLIPARKTDPEHEHFDIRYLIVADDSHPLVISEESNDLRWVSLDDARILTQERSMIRQFDKIEMLMPFVHKGRLRVVDFSGFDPILS